MKKFLSILLALSLLLSCSAPALADSSLVSFNATLTGLMDYTASDWNESGLSRALLTIMLMVDLASANDSVGATSMIAYDTYVARLDSGAMMVLGYGENAQIAIFYEPVSKTAYYAADKNVSLYAFLLTSESTLLGLDGTLTAHKNDRSDLNTALELLSSIFNSD